MSLKIGIAEVYVEQTGEKGGLLMKTGYAVTFNGRVVLTRSGEANWSFDEEEVKQRAQELTKGSDSATTDF